MTQSERYYLVDVLERDGEFHYGCHVVTRAGSPEDAEAKVKAESWRGDMEWDNESDFPIITVDGMREIPADDYAVLSAYLVEFP